MENDKQELVSMEEQIGKPLRKIALLMLLLMIGVVGFIVGLVLAEFTK